jgi:hypothetical protein
MKDHYFHDTGRLLLDITLRTLAGLRDILPFSGLTR